MIVYEHLRPQTHWTRGSPLTMHTHMKNSHWIVVPASPRSELLAARRLKRLNSECHQPRFTRSST